MTADVAHSLKMKSNLVSINVFKLLKNIFRDIFYLLYDLFIQRIAYNLFDFRKTMTEKSHLSWTSKLLKSIKRAPTLRGADQPTKRGILFLKLRTIHCSTARANAEAGWRFARNSATLGTLSCK